MLALLSIKALNSRNSIIHKKCIQSEALRTSAPMLHFNKYIILNGQSTNIF